MPTDPFCCVKACEQGPAEQNTREHGEDAGVKRTQDLAMRNFGAYGPHDAQFRAYTRLLEYPRTANCLGNSVLSLTAGRDLTKDNAEKSKTMADRVHPALHHLPVEIRGAEVHGDATVLRQAPGVVW